LHCNSIDDLSETLLTATPHYIEQKDRLSILITTNESKILNYHIMASRIELLREMPYFSLSNTQLSTLSNHKDGSVIDT